MVLKKTLLYIDVIRRLGFFNVAYIAWYRFSLKAGIRRTWFPQRALPAADGYFLPCSPRQDYPEAWKASLLEAADKIVEGNVRYYACHWKAVGSPPDWFLNPFNGAHYPDTQLHWIRLADFHPAVGDIKNVWEASRFEWVSTLSRACAATGKEIYVTTLNAWLQNWAKKNPLNTGPNWKCGQEAAIRVFSLINAALILHQADKPAAALTDLVYEHLGRIAGNTGYAIAQDNNHGTSEAAGLFIGGGWLAYIDKARYPRAEKFARQGRRLLENRVKKLIEDDGSFSQHSVTYHRVLLDTLIFVEHWRRKIGADSFSATFYQRAKAALHWLFMLTDAQSGNAPNLGANDGAMLLHTHACDYRDFRPSIQTASVLLYNQKCFKNGPWDEPGFWFGLSGKEAEVSDCRRESEVFPGGYVVMVGRESWGMIRFPMYRFRPGHNDVFHFDLWYRGVNICRDAGSYSYNPEEASDGAYFHSVKAHNTIGFDDNEQMPRLGRFLLGQWIQADHVGAVERGDNGSQSWTGAYRDYRGNRHQRTILWKEDEWLIEDSFSGAFAKADSMYRLVPGSYRREGNTVSASWGKIKVSGSDFEIKMSGGLESLYYWQKQPVDTLIVHAGKNCGKITTRFVLGR